MILGEDLLRELSYLPPYQEDICNQEPGVRLIASNAIAELFIPSSMSMEIYSKIYLSMIRSLQKKQTVEAVTQAKENYKRTQGLIGNSILGGVDSFSITGPSGIGKSTSISKAIALCGGNDIITTKEPYSKIIPCLNIQCSHDSSVKGTLLDILGQVDLIIGTNYRELSIKNRSTTDVLIGTVSQVALHHICLLVLDECQNIYRNKSGINLVAALTQIINSSGISICMVGLPETDELFSREMQLARRSVGLSYSRLPYDDYFVKFCETLFVYQYVKHPVELTPDIIELLYEYSGGIIAIVVSLMMEAQQLAIISGAETLNKEIFRQAYNRRMKNVQDFVQVEMKKRKSTSSIKDNKSAEFDVMEIEPQFTFEAAARNNSNEDITQLLMAQHIVVEVV